jgi:hypothetical protein
VVWSQCPKVIKCKASITLQAKILDGKHGKFFRPERGLIFGILPGTPAQGRKNEATLAPIHAVLIGFTLGWIRKSIFYFAKYEIKFTSLQNFANKCCEISQTEFSW